MSLAFESEREHFHFATIGAALRLLRCFGLTSATTSPSRQSRRHSVAARVIKCGAGETRAADGRDRRRHHARRHDDRGRHRRSPRLDLGRRHRRAEVAARRTRRLGPLGRAVARWRDARLRRRRPHALCMWNIGTGAAGVPNPGLREPIAAVCLHPNNQQLAVVGFSNELANRQHLDGPRRRKSSMARASIFARSRSRRRATGWRRPAATARFASGT